MSNPDAIDPLDALFARARRELQPDRGAGQYGFETRLMARLRATHSAETIWATVSWRLIPFLAACVVALFVWQSDVAADTNDAAGIASLNNPVAADLWSN